VRHILSSCQFAGIMTKALPIELFTDFRYCLDVRDPPAQLQASIRLVYTCAGVCTLMCVGGAHVASHFNMTNMKGHFRRPFLIKAKSLSSKASYSNSAELLLQTLTFTHN
jgi:hypothetical protein